STAMHFSGFPGRSKPRCDWRMSPRIGARALIFRLAPIDPEPALAQAGQRGAGGMGKPTLATGKAQERSEVLKPFIAIQRVQLPPGKGQPTSRKRALHGVRRRPS